MKIGTKSVLYGALFFPASVVRGGTQRQHPAGLFQCD